MTAKVPWGRSWCEAARFANAATLNNTGRVGSQMELPADQDVTGII